MLDRLFEASVAMRTMRWFFFCALLSIAAVACGDDDGGGAGGGVGGGAGGGVGGGAGGGVGGVGGGAGGGAGDDAGVGDAGGDAGDAGLDSDAMVPDAGPIPTTTELHGLVRDDNSLAPIAGAKLLVYPVVGEALQLDDVFAVTAAGDGAWSTGPIDPGRYHVRVDTSGGYWRTAVDAPAQAFSDFSDVATSGDWTIGGDVVGEAALVRITRGDASTFMRLASALAPPFTVEVTLRVTQQTWESMFDGFRVMAAGVCDGGGDLGGRLRDLQLQFYVGGSIAELTSDCGGTGYIYKPTGLAQPSDWKTMRIEVGLGAFIGEPGTAAPIVRPAAGTTYELDLPGAHEDGNGGDTDAPTILEVSGIRIYDRLFGETVDAPAGASVDVGTFEAVSPL